MHTLHGKLLLVAGHTEVLVLLGDEALGADGLLASLAGEAGLVPAVTLMLHLPGALGGGGWRDQAAENTNTDGLRCGWFLVLKRLIIQNGSTPVPYLA